MRVIFVRKWFISILQKILNRLQIKLNKEEQLSRKARFGQFLHETEILEADSFKLVLKEKVIIEDGKFNFFLLPNGELPVFDFAIPEILLYILIPGIESAEWSIASTRGISRSDWEAAQSTLSYIEDSLERMVSDEVKRVPRVLILRWHEPINYFYLRDRIRGLLKNETV